MENCLCTLIDCAYYLVDYKLEDLDDDVDIDAASSVRGQKDWPAVPLLLSLSICAVSQMKDSAANAKDATTSNIKKNYAEAKDSLTSGIDSKLAAQKEALKDQEKSSVDAAKSHASLVSSSSVV